jgi:hypothetical protein
VDAKLCLLGKSAIFANKMYLSTILNKTQRSKTLYANISKKPNKCYYKPCANITLAEFILSEVTDLIYSTTSRTTIYSPYGRTIWSVALKNVTGSFVSFLSQKLEGYSTIFVQIHKFENTIFYILTI